MKNYILLLLATCIFIVACTSKNQTNTASTSSMSGNLTLPYTASYATEFNNDVSDSVLLNVLNSYKYWETGDINALRTTMNDSAYVEGADGFRFKGLTDSLMHIWRTMRDSLSSVKITMDVWLKNHSVKDSSDYINVWYKEIDTYKNGKVDSANFEDDNGIKNGKIIWFSSHRQALAKMK